MKIAKSQLSFLPTFYLAEVAFWMITTSSTELLTSGRDGVKTRLAVS